MDGRALQLDWDTGKPKRSFKLADGRNYDKAVRADRRELKEQRVRDSDPKKRRTGRPTPA